ncbi:MAG: benzil reductase ((S)-benzoin forming) [Flavobacteriaceae bacterium]|jgi:benzil reductase ((S)-benzoin forming)
MIIITGVSRGLGKAIAEHYLAEGHYVLGIGRSSDIQHASFSFKQCDLSNLEQVKELKFDVFAGPITLINNAGIIGEIKRLSDQASLDIDEVMTVNVSAVAILTNLVYQHSLDKDKFTLVNISSGAANRAIPSWAIYCASKAALNMLTETFYLEEKEQGREISAYAVSPGVIDTGMQVQIRETRKEDFSSVDNFIKMKENDELFSPEEAAKRLAALLYQPFNGEVFVDLREITVK